jgi:hypothetical protein
MSGNAKTAETGQTAPRLTLAQLAQDWGRLHCVHVTKLPGFEATAGKLFVGATIEWPKGADDHRVESAKIVGLEVLPGNLLAVTVRSVEPQYRGQLARMVLDLSGCVVIFQEPVPAALPEGVVEINGEVRDTALLRPAEVEAVKSAAEPGQKPLQDVLAEAEIGGAVSQEDVSRLLKAVNDPEWADRRPRLVTVLRRLAGQRPAAVAVAPPRVAAEKASSGGGDDDGPIPEGRIETSDPRDRVAVMTKGR